MGAGKDVKPSPTHPIRPQGISEAGAETVLLLGLMDGRCAVTGNRVPVTCVVIGLSGFRSDIAEITMTTLQRDKELGLAPSHSGSHNSDNDHTVAYTTINDRTTTARTFVRQRDLSNRYGTQNTVD
ncbi:hypothetical protein BaRGS_00021106 [Batillaria attramentaria]|uniref:Uncharacterized protein n=1 Tax=Batillaria attramentaria TaxID=370345 RepID=A0ABD0KKX3_9CAEN